MPFQSAAARRAAKSSRSKTLKGKYVGKEEYKGLTANAPKGKYKGKYIGPDKYKGDVAAWQADRRNKTSPLKPIKTPVPPSTIAPIKGGKKPTPPGYVPIKNPEMREM